LLNSYSGEPRPHYFGRAARNLDFERAAEIRDLIKELENDKDKSYAP